MFGRRLLSSLLWSKTCKKKININEIRFIHGILHNQKRCIFYVKFKDSNEKAVLTYRKNGKILDFRTIVVPEEHQGEGLARRLTEAAFTYAIVNNYHMYLSCLFVQKYYLVIKNAELDELVVGPPHVLEGPYSEIPYLDAVYDMPSPEDFMF